MRTVPMSLLLVFLSSTGCTSLFDAFVPSHAASGKDAPEAICVRLRPQPHDPTQIRGQAVPAIVAVGATVLVGVAVDQFAKAVEHEAQRYKASYSGRDASYLFLFDRRGTSESLKPFAGEIVVARYYNENACPQALMEGSGAVDYGKPALKFVAHIELSDAAAIPVKGRVTPAIRLVPDELSIRLSKAKVSSFKGKVDLGVQLTLSTFVADDKGTVSQADIAQVDFPLGKLPLPAEGGETVLKGNQLKHLASGWLSLPSFKAPLVEGSASGQWKVGLLNLTATVLEAADLGDVIAKGAKTVGDNRDKIVEALLKTLGLTQEDKK